MPVSKTTREEDERLREELRNVDREKLKAAIRSVIHADHKRGSEKPARHKKT